MTRFVRIHVFSAFERFWHWAQAALIIGMGLTGFEIHGFYALLGFETAVTVHTSMAWALMGLWVFAIFWHFTTGEWKQYVPLTDRDTLIAMFRYYLAGIFLAAPHPFRVTHQQKHNPLQRMAYLGVKLAINPLIWGSGLLLLFYGNWDALGLDGLSLGQVALAHTAAAFLMAFFLVVHLYFITTGHTVLAQIKAMITGYDEVEDVDGEAAK